MKTKQGILLTQCDKRMPYRKAYLDDRNGNIQLPWHIIYYYYDENKDHLKRRLFKGGLNNLRTATQRYREAREMMVELNTSLVRGELYIPKKMSLI